MRVPPRLDCDILFCLIVDIACCVSFLNFLKFARSHKTVCRELVRSHNLLDEDYSIDLPNFILRLNL